jgi:hypothetical protein
LTIAGGTSSGTDSISTTVTTGTVNVFTGVITGGTINIGGAGSNTVFGGNVNITGSVSAGSFTFSLLGFQKDSDVTGAGNVAFTATPYTNQGTSFGTMASNGTFTFSQAGVYQVNVAYNVSADPDGWGGINGTTGTRYNQASGSQVKNSVTDIISVSVNDTYTWKVNNNVTVYGTGDTKTRIQFTKIG